MATRALFPTLIYSDALQSRGTEAFNRQLLHEIGQLRQDDRAGCDWSEDHYPGGFTTYASANRMHTISPTFAALEQKMRRICANSAVRWVWTCGAASSR